MTRVRAGLALTLIAAVAGCGPAPREATSTSGSTHGLLPQQTHAIPIAMPPPVTNACPGQSASSAHCDVMERDDIEPIANSDHLTPAQIPGFHPADIERAYALPATPGGTIAIVVPYHDAAAASDLAVYRAKFGLPACTASNGCLRFIAQNGSPKLPPSNAAWTTETSVDLEIASAACPACRLLVVEASSDGLPDMIAALREAIARHPAVVSNSWIVPETALAPAVALNHPGVPVVAGSGDRASGVSWPASDPTIVAVGGTTLVADESARGFSESAWGSAGFGCSALFSKPAWQATQCTTRAVADVSALADPAAGVAIYDSIPLGRGPHKWSSGWAVYGGTSVATPIVAAAIALANNSAQLSTPQYIYQHAADLNAVSAAASPLQAGLGSPRGIGAF